MSPSPTIGPPESDETATATIGTAAARSLTRSRTPSISIRWIVTLAAAALTTASVLAVGAVTERSTRGALTREIEARLLLESRNLAITGGEALLTDFPELTLHPLVKEMRERQPELAMVLVIDNRGKIQGERDARRLGTSYVRDPGLSPIESTQRLGPGETMMSDRQILVASAPVRHRNGRRIGTALVGLRRDYLDHLVQAARRQQMGVLGVVLAVGFVLSFLLLSWILRPIQTLRNGIERIGSGDLDTPLQLRDRTELGLLAEAVNDMASALKQAQSEMMERERLTREVELARQIQSSLLPNRSKEVAGFVIEGSQRAAAEVGGDYFDYFVLADGRIGIAVADVAGKGLAGCLVMSMLSALLRAYRASISSPAEMLAVLDERLGETLQTGSFVTMFYGVLDPNTGKVVYASAGHSPLLIYRQAQGAVEWFRTKGIPLGAIRGGAIRKTLWDATLTLERGDLLVQFTDGLNEAFDASGKEQFGFQRVENVVIESAGRGCGGVIAALHRGIEVWTRGCPAFDDETVLVVSRDEPGVTVPPREREDGDDLTASPDHAVAMAGLQEARANGHCIRLRATLDSLPRIRDWLTERLPESHRVGSRFEILSTALYEACANIAEHGCRFDPSQEFELWWVPGRQGASPTGSRSQARSSPTAHPLPPAEATGRFIIRDHGKPFRADNWNRTDFSDRRVWKRGRGFGLDIIHRAMSRVEYHPATAEGNLTLMTFDLENAPEEVRHA